MSRLATVVLGVVLAAALVSSQTDDVTRLSSALNVAEPSNVFDAYVSAIGLEALGKPVPKSYCKAAESVRDGSLADVFRAVRVAELASCKLDALSAHASQQAKTGLASGDPANIHHAVVVSRFFKNAVDTASVLSSLEKIIDGEYTVGGAGHIFSTVALLDTKPEDRQPYVELIEDVINQAETTDSSAWFEGGLPATAAIVRGMYALAEKHGSAPKISEDEAASFLNYFLAARYARSLVSASSVAIGLGTYANNPFQRAILISKATNSALSAAKPDFAVTVTNTLGASVPGLSVDISSVKDQDGSNKGVKLSLSQSSGNTYSGKLGSQLERGVYTVTVSAKSSDTKYFSSSETFSATVAVAADVTSADVKVYDGSSVSTTKTAKRPGTIGAKLSLDGSQRLGVEFAVTSGGKAIDVAQAFVRLTNTKTKAEIHFVAASKSDGYAMTLDVKRSASSFNSVSGDYDVTIIVGDESISPSLEWTVGTVTITFKKSAPSASDAVSPFEPKPEITHMFREPDARPPTVVSLAFAAMALAPILLLLGLWVALGANISNFPFGNLFAIAFHLCIGAILMLFVTYWLRLNMFDTLTYLAPLLVATMFTGRATLRSLAAKRT